MPKCKNDESKSYKGDEPSPKGLGYCAHAEKEGSEKKGKDGNMWEVKMVSSGSKRWVKVKEITNWLDIYSPPLTPKQKRILKIDFKTDILKKKLKSIDVFFNIETLKLQDNGYYITNYIGRKTEEKLGEHWNEKEFIILIVRINRQNEIVLLGKGYDGDLELDHNINKNNFSEIIKIFKEIYGKKFTWSGKQKDQMFIKI